MWNWTLRNVLIPAGDRVFGSRLAKRLRFLEEAQWWSPERLREHRLRLLAQTLRLAYEDVPLHRANMEQAGLRPEDIRTEEDLARLPILTKSVLNAGYPASTTRKTGQKTYESFTSGSTGQNFRVLEDAETAGWYRSSAQLAFEWAGFRLGEPHVQTGMNLVRSLDRRLKDRFTRCLYVSAFELDDAHLDPVLEAMERRSIRHLMGYPASLFFLARRAEARGWSRALASAITWGDTVYPVYRAAIERVFRTRLFDTYGCAEGMQISAQCGTGQTYHVHALDVIVEYVDDTGRKVPEGERGNIVLTRLHAGPMPFVRYRIGDVGRSGRSRRCECGRGFEVMESIEGRETDVVLTPSGNRLIVHYFTGLLEYYTAVESFQVVQETVDSIRLLLVPRSPLTPELTSRIVADLQNHGARDLRIDVEVVKEIPVASTGKRRFVISKLAPYSRA